jgi:hypothetical protein
MQTPDPHPLLVPLLEKHGVTHAEFLKRGRPARGREHVVDVRRAIITELHALGTSWAEMLAVTGLGQGSIQRLTGAMWNSESRKVLHEVGARVGRSWKGKTRPGQLESQWAAGDFDRPSTRAKYSRNRVLFIKAHPEFNYPYGKSEWVQSVKGGRFKVRSSYEKKASELLDSREDVVSYLFEECLVLSDGWHILPDFIVNHQDGTRTLIEVKPSYALDPTYRGYTKVRARLGVAEEEARRRGWAFKVWTERELGC